MRLMVGSCKDIRFDELNKKENEEMLVIFSLNRRVVRQFGIILRMFFPMHVYFYIQCMY